MQQQNAELQQRRDARKANKKLYEEWCLFKDTPSTEYGIGGLLADVRVTQVQQHEMLKQHTDQLQQLAQHADQFNRKLDGLMLGGLAVLGLVLYDRRGGRRGGGRT